MTQESPLTLGGDKSLVSDFQRIKFAPFRLVHAIAAAADPPKLAGRMAIQDRDRSTSMDMGKASTEQP